MSFTVLVIEDEPYARDELIYILSRFSFCEIIGEAESGQEAIALCKKLKPEVLFLDIELPDMSGMEVARVVSDFSLAPLIVFATAYDEYAVEAFEVGAIDYILKPFEESRIEKTLQRIERLKLNKEDWIMALKKISEFVSSATLKKLPVQQSDGIIDLIAYRDILFCESAGKGVRVITHKGEYLFNGTLSDLEVRLKLDGFLRVHKSYLINLKKIQAVIPWFKGTYWIVLEGEKRQIPVSKSLIKELKEILGIRCS